jgi:hypothetical protein
MEFILGTRVEHESDASYKVYHFGYMSGDHNYKSWSRLSSFKRFEILFMKVREAKWDLVQFLCGV